MKKDLVPLEMKPVLALPAGLKVTTLEVMENVLTIPVASTHVRAACPLCGMSAVRVHSCYRPGVSFLLTKANVPDNCRYLLYMGGKNAHQDRRGAVQS